MGGFFFSGIYLRCIEGNCGIVHVLCMRFDKKQPQGHNYKPPKQALKLNSVTVTLNSNFHHVLVFFRMFYRGLLCITLTAIPHSSHPSESVGVTYDIPKESIGYGRTCKAKKSVITVDSKQMRGHSPA